MKMKHTNKYISNLSKNGIEIQLDIGDVLKHKIRTNKLDMTIDDHIKEVNDVRELYIQNKSSDKKEHTLILHEFAIKLSYFRKIKKAREALQPAQPKYREMCIQVSM